MEPVSCRADRAGTETSEGLETGINWQRRRKGRLSEEGWHGTEGPFLRNTLP